MLDPSLNTSKKNEGLAAREHAEAHERAALCEEGRFQIHWSMSALSAPPGGQICFGHKICLKMMEEHVMIKEQRVPPNS